MSDIFTPVERSAIMSKIKSKGNKSTELKLIAYFKAKSYKGWRRHYPVAGKPDFAFPKLKIAVFADGCFWHGHDCRNLKPEQNAQYWSAKIERNKQRDSLVNEILSSKGWKVLRLWECQIKKGNFEALDKALSHVPE